MIRIPASGMPRTRPVVLPGLQKWGTTRSQIAELQTGAAVVVIQRSRLAMMSGSAWQGAGGSGRWIGRHRNPVAPRAS